jgi:hypothetical protein
MGESGIILPLSDTVGILQNIFLTNGKYTSIKLKLAVVKNFQFEIILKN